MSASKKVVIALDNWANTWLYVANDPGPGPLRTGHLDAFYKYSSEWTAVWEQCWLDYERVEEDRRAATVTNRP